MKNKFIVSTLLAALLLVSPNVKSASFTDNQIVDSINVETQLEEVSKTVLSTAPQDVYNNTNSNIIAHSKRRPIVTFVDDDGYLQTYTILKPIFESNGVPFVSAVIAGDVGNSGRMTASQILELQNHYNCEIASHTKSGGNLAKLTDIQIEKEIGEGKNVLEKMGCNITGLVYPQGGENEVIRRIAKKHHKYACSVESPTIKINTGVIPSFSIKRINLGSFFDSPQPGYPATNTLEYYKARVDDAVASNGWLVFEMHSWNTDFTTTQQSYLDKTIKYIKSLDVDILTLNDAYKIFGNTLEAGDYTGGIDYPAISKDGQSNFNFIKIKPLNTYRFSNLITDFPSNSITYSSINYSAAKGFPDNSAGLLITYRFAGNGWDRQEFKKFKSNETWSRYVDLDGSWTPFVKVSP